MANALAGIALHIWFKLTSIFIRTRKTTAGSVCVAVIKSPTITAASTVKALMFETASTAASTAAPTIKSPSFETASTESALFQTERLRAVTLDMTIGVIIATFRSSDVINHIPALVRSHDAVDTWFTYVTHTVFGIAINHRCNAVYVEMVREISIIFWITVGIDAGLERGNHVSVVGWSNSLEEDVRAVAQRIEYILLGLETEVKEVALTEFQDIRVLTPIWLGNRDGCVESRDK
jgi:hypothetical protein